MSCGQTNRRSPRRIVRSRCPARGMPYSVTTSFAAASPDGRGRRRNGIGPVAPGPRIDAQYSASGSTYFFWPKARVPGVSRETARSPAMRRMISIHWSLLRPVRSASWSEWQLSHWITRCFCSSVPGSAATISAAVASASVGCRDRSVKSTRLVCPAVSVAVCVAARSQAARSPPHSRPARARPIPEMRTRRAVREDVHRDRAVLTARPHGDALRAVRRRTRRLLPPSSDSPAASGRPCQQRPATAAPRKVTSAYRRTPDSVTITDLLGPPPFPVPVSRSASPNPTRARLPRSARPRRRAAPRSGCRAGCRCGLGLRCAPRRLRASCRRAAALARRLRSRRRSSPRLACARRPVPFHSLPASWGVTPPSGPQRVASFRVRLLLPESALQLAHVVRGPAPTGGVGSGLAGLALGL